MQAKYILGHSAEEIERLMLQAAILRPFTERLLREAKIEPGMRVLDIGSGAGDVSMLAAELVGPSGSVVGIDSSEQAVAQAGARAQTAGLRQVVFKNVGLDAFADPEPFDFVIGRYVLVFQIDPVQFLRSAAKLTKPGGVIALHEINLAGYFVSDPPVHQWDAMGNLIFAAFREALPHYDSANHMVRHFTNAGLPVPNLFRESITGGWEEGRFYLWLARSLRSVWPQLVEMGIVTEQAIHAEGLAAKLQDAVVRARSQVRSPAQVCAWAKL